MCVPVVRNSVKKEEREEEEDFTIYQKMGTGISLKKKKKNNRNCTGEKNHSEGRESGLYLGGQPFMKTQMPIPTNSGLLPGLP